MSSQKITSKKLKAIMFTDIVDFTQLSSNNESYAIKLIDKQREILKPIVNQYRGEWLKEIGDGILICFDSSLDAIECSIEIQKSLLNIPDLNIRVGIHQGDIFIKDNDVYGDDVNIASRVEGFSPNGGVAISDKINRDISGVSKIKTSFIGFKKLKGVMQETKIYCINVEGLPVFRKQWLPYLTGLLLTSIGAIAFTATTAGFLITKFTSILIFPDQGWGDLFKALIRHFSIFIFGYSNLMYVNGVSSKTHRYFVYGSYFLIIIYLFAIISFSFKI
tara:strand:+ start:203 stop:1030 length:828 start_codon:yes stop_codon:yes gene_type:complete